MKGHGKYIIAHRRCIHLRGFYLTYEGPDVDRFVYSIFPLKFGTYNVTGLALRFDRAGQAREVIDQYPDELADYRVCTLGGSFTPTMDKDPRDGRP